MAVLRKMILLLIVAALAAPAAGAVVSEAPAGVPVGALLQALDDAGYRATLDYLLDGGTLQNGSKGEAVTGLQRALIALGQPIAADGAMGPLTVGALNEARRAFGLEPAETVDADGFIALLARVLAVTDEAAAESVLSALPRGEYEYIRGCALGLRGLYYSARQAFEGCGYADGAARAALCAQPLPATGRLWRDGSLSGNDAALTVRRTGEGGFVARVYTSDGRPAATLFIAGEGEADVTLPAGEYMIADGEGAVWYGEAETFGGDGVYERMLFQDGARLLTLRSEQRVILTVDGDTEKGEPLGAEALTWDQF